MDGSRYTKSTWQVGAKAIAALSRSPGGKFTRETIEHVGNKWVTAGGRRYSITTGCSDGNYEHYIYPSILVYECDMNRALENRAIAKWLSWGVYHKLTAETRYGIIRDLGLTIEPFKLDEK